MKNLIIPNADIIKLPVCVDMSIQRRSSFGSLFGINIVSDIAKMPSTRILHLLRIYLHGKNLQQITYSNAQKSKHEHLTMYQVPFDSQRITLSQGAIKSIRITPRMTINQFHKNKVIRLLSSSSSSYATQDLDSFSWPRIPDM